MDEPTGWCKEQELISCHMVSIFKWRITPSTKSSPRAPLEMNVQLACDCTHVAEQAAAAFLNPLYLPWDIAAYSSALTPKQSGQKAEAERLIGEQFPAPEISEIVQSPTTVVDSSGKIVLWHLPNAISRARQKSVWDKLPNLNPVIKRPATPNAITDNKGSWRASSDLFYPGASRLNPGLLNLSPAWFQTGHETGKPEVSASLKNSKSPTVQWTIENREFSRLMGGLLAIVHPKLYRDCMATFQQFSLKPTESLKDPEPFQRVIDAWGNPFGGLALICNRKTPVHRDNNSRYYWYDILASLGDYDKLEFNIPGIGRKFSYEPGTVVALSGRALTHEVPEANGERACFAYFVRDKVLRYAGKHNGTWPLYQEVLTATDTY